MQVPVQGESPPFYIESCQDKLKSCLTSTLLDGTQTLCLTYRN